MSRYYFHIEYGEYSPDMVGTEFASHAAARTAAVTLLGELLRDKRDAFWAKPDVVVTVTDELGLTLWTLSVTASIAPSVARETSQLG
jgi:hypothetical protein